MVIGAWTANDSLVVIGAVSLVLYFAAALYAKGQLNEARQLRRERSRPFVVVDFEVSWLISLTIKNIGQTIAHDIRIEFLPELQSTLSKPWSWETGGLLETGIAMLPPGKTVKYSFDSSIKLYGSDLPKKYEARVTYSDSLGNRLKEPDVYILDLGVYMGSSPPVDDLHELAKEVKALRVEVAKWTDGIRGIKVTTEELDRKRKDERRFVRLQLRHHGEPRSGWRGIWDKVCLKVDELVEGWRYP